MTIEGGAEEWVCRCYFVVQEDCANQLGGEGKGHLVVVGNVRGTMYRGALEQGWKERKRAV